VIVKVISNPPDLNAAKKAAASFFVFPCVHACQGAVLAFFHSFFFALVCLWIVAFSPVSIAVKSQRLA
jgi:hypothetical protein